jgi:hypothetical protein
VVELNKVITDHLTLKLQMAALIAELPLDANLGQAPSASLPEGSGGSARWLGAILSKDSATQAEIHQFEAAQASFQRRVRPSPHPPRCILGRGSIPVLALVDA